MILFSEASVSLDYQCEIKIRKEILVKGQSTGFHVLGALNLEYAKTTIGRIRELNKSMNFVTVTKPIDPANTSYLVG